MKVNLKRKLVLILLSIIMVMGNIAFGQESTVVILGNNLNQQQRQEMLNVFGVKETEVTILYVTNEEERAYLKGIAPDKQIGTRSISSAYVKNLSPGEGISVETYNINWVTAEMYQNALVTAGVTDAKIIAAAPFSVSGTAALTGILKAFEELRGKEISEERKQIANIEMVRTGELGEQIGREKASQLIKEIKEEVVEKKVKNPAEIKKIIVDIAGRLDINLNPQQIEEITKLMEQISKLNLNTKEIRQQLKGISRQIGDLAKQNEEVKSFLDQIVGLFKKLIESIMGMLGK